MVCSRIGLCALLLFGSTTRAFAQSTITVAWDANTEPEVAGYVLSWGTTQGVYTSSVDAGTQTAWTLTGLDPNQRYYFTVQAYTADPVYSVPADPVSNNALITTTLIPPLDNRPNIFWQHRTSGLLMTWHMVGTTIVDTRPISISQVADTNWRINGVGDMNADGHSDLVWRHATDGRLAVWFLQNNAVAGTSPLSISHMTDANWRLGGVGDMDGDRFADIVWQHNPTGRLAIWFMQGATVARTETVSLNVGPFSRWQIATVGDVDKDGCADIIWQTTDGFLATWLMRGASVRLTKYFSISQMPDGDWRIVAAGNVDGTGNAALLWRHAVRGDVALWYVNGADVITTIKTNPNRVDDADWKIVGSR